MSWSMLSSQSRSSIALLISDCGICGDTTFGCNGTGLHNAQTADQPGRAEHEGEWDVDAVAEQVVGGPVRVSD